MSSRALLIGGFALLAAAMIILAGATLWSQHTNRTYAARADMAYAQALQVTRLEALSLRVGNAEDAVRRALAERARAYLATIAEEQRLLGEDPAEIVHLAQEQASAERLVAAIGDPGQPIDLAQVRTLANAIAAREMREAAAARAKAEAVARQTRAVVMIAAAAVLLLPIAAALVLQRQVLTPLRDLGAATHDLAEARRGERPAPAGLAEIRALTARFNAMAEAVEARVAERTADLERANAELAEVDSRRRLFLAKVSHELRTPVTAIRGEAEVSLNNGGSPEDQREALEHIAQNTLFLQRRLDDLLILARAEDARLPVATGRVDPVALARTTVDALAAFARVSNVRLAFCPPGADAAPVAVVGHPDRLHQALAAVIDNAIKFSPPGGTVTVSCAMEDGAAVLAVTDDGPGVEAADLARIFDPYVQGKAGRSLGGTGLGLSLARWIVESYDGTISARPGPGTDAGGEGLCVTMRLPIAG